MDFSRQIIKKKLATALTETLGGDWIKVVTEPRFFTDIFLKISDCLQ